MAVANVKAAKVLFLVAVTSIGYEMVRRARAAGPIGPGPRRDGSA
jgi:hypothetical protein